MRQAVLIHDRPAGTVRAFQQIVDSAAIGPRTNNRILLAYDSFGCEIFNGKLCFRPGITTVCCHKTAFSCYNPTVVRLQTNRVYIDGGNTLRPVQGKRVKHYSPVPEILRFGQDVSIAHNQSSLVQGRIPKSSGNLLRNNAAAADPVLTQRTVAARAGNTEELFPGFGIADVVKLIGGDT